MEGCRGADGTLAQEGQVEGGRRGTCSPTKQKVISTIDSTRVSPDPPGARRGFLDGEYSSFRGSRSCSDASVAMTISASLASLTINSGRQRASAHGGLVQVRVQAIMSVNRSIGRMDKIR